MSPAAGDAQGFCPQCGAKVTETQRFCRICGTDLSVTDETGELGSAAATAEPTAATAEPTAAPASAPAGTPEPPATAPLSPPTTAPMPAQVAATEPMASPPAPAGRLHWSAWMAAVACSVLVVAVGLPWIGGGFGFDGFDVPVAGLFSDTATGGLPIGVIFLVIAATGIAVALINPAPRPLGLTFLIVGLASTLLLLWYVIRVLSVLNGAPVLDALSIGVWAAILASIATLVGGIVLQTSARHAS